MRSLPAAPFLIRGAIVALLALVALLTFHEDGQIARAAAISVTTTEDELNTDGDCSLREAIQAANTDSSVDACLAGSGADIVSLAAGTYVLSKTGRGEDANAIGDLDVLGDITVVGAGAAATIIQGAWTDRVFHIHGGVTAEITSLTICCGQAVAVGGGILNDGALTLNNSTVSGNFSEASGSRGGGIQNNSTLTLNNSTVSGNATTGSGSRGGGISNYSTLTLNNSTVSGNATTWSGSVGGGGIYNFFNNSTLTLNNSTVSGNSTSGGGGGVDNWGVLTVNNSTISNNTAGGNGDGGGIRTNLGATATLNSTIIANNPSGAECRTVSGITSAGHNLSSDGSCGLAGTGDLPGTAPLLGPLADNGGPTRTHALLVGSPAIDAGSPGCPPPTADQRGAARTAVCDIGANEFGSAPPGPAPVGGIAELPEVEGTPLETPSSSGPNAGLLAGVAAAVAAGTAAVVGAAWYARRRVTR